MPGKAQSRYGRGRNLPSGTCKYSLAPHRCLYLLKLEEKWIQSQHRAYSSDMLKIRGLGYISYSTNKEERRLPQEKWCLIRTHQREKGWGLSRKWSRNVKAPEHAPLGIEAIVSTSHVICLVSTPTIEILRIRTRMQTKHQHQHLPH